MPKSKPRLLCLHGDGANDEVTALQMVGLGPRISELADFVFLHAPHATKLPAPGLIVPSSNGPFYNWSDSSKSLLEQEEQWDESLRYVAEFCKRKGPFDGAYGFSEGAGILTNFSHPKVWKERFKMKQCPWRFVILACGASDHRMTIGLGDYIKMPSFHIHGKKDRRMSGGKAIMSGYWDPSQRVAQFHAKGHEIDAHMWTRVHKMNTQLNMFVDYNLSVDTGFVNSWSRWLCCGNEFYLFGWTFGCDSCRDSCRDGYDCR
ncbi:hypothetical protein ACHAWF_004850 [Thalassiosira exigua]